MEITLKPHEIQKLRMAADEYKLKTGKQYDFKKVITNLSRFYESRLEEDLEIVIKRKIEDEMRKQGG